MHSIENFAAGLIPNAAWSNLRNIAAQNWSNLRVNPQGFAIQRDGHRVVFHADPSTQIFAYRNLLFAIIDGKLKWARAQARGETVTFNDFDPALELNTDYRYHFQPYLTADHEYILFDNGTGNPEGPGARHLRGGPYYIDLANVFEASEPQAPTVSRCYLPEPDNPYGIRSTRVNEDNITGSDQLTLKQRIAIGAAFGPIGAAVAAATADLTNENLTPDAHVDFYFQAVKVIGEQESIPWIYDFTEQPYADVPEIAPTLVVSDATPSIEVEGNIPFVAAIAGEGGTDNGSGDNELPLRVTGVTGGGDSPTNSVVVNTDTTPDSIKTQGAAQSWAILPGSIDVEVSDYDRLRDWLSTVKLQVRVNSGSWRTIGEEENWLDRSLINQEDNVSFSYDAHSLGYIATESVIEFRVTSTNGTIRLLGSQEIRLNVQTGLSVFNLLDVSQLEKVILETEGEGEGEGEDISARFDLQPRTEIRFYTNLRGGAEDADYIDVYISRRHQLGSPRRAGYQLIARLPHQDQYQFTVKIPCHDSLMPFNWIDKIPEQGELVTWNYIEADEHRTYAAARDSNRLYLSDFDGIARRHFMNFTHFIDLPTGGEEITGVKFLYDNFLVVYTPHKILNIYTDPAPERMRIVSRYSPGAEDEAVGCIAPLSLVELGEHHIFLSPNKQIYRYGGRKPVWTSAPVQPLLEPLALPEAPDASFELSNAVAVAHKGDYHLSFPSLTEEPIHYLYWKGQRLTWKGGNLEWKQDYFAPNNTLIYDFDRDKWYKDGFGVTSYAKDPRDRLYGIVAGNILSLYDDSESDEEFDWLWQSNQILLPPRTTIFNVTVKTQIAVDMEVKVKTENGEQTRQLEARHADDYWGQYAGFDLIGRTVEITVTGRGRTVIDRININEMV